jgi:glucose-1-phosphate cytidylyltransferase
VFRKEFFGYLEEQGSMEQAPLRRLASDGQLAVYEHRGFWQAMDTFKEVDAFNREWNRGNRPWVVWDEKGTDGR